ncbi:MAG: ABC transporter substrate-binding protein [Alphaproteobacteria bacterium]|nr:MAG: ABC transporter substrate-binding protein [Alphaproteobacteria bacterium]
MPPAWTARQKETQAPRSTDRPQERSPNREETMTEKRFASTVPDDVTARMKREFDEAHDFDPRDPLFGLDKHDLAGPVLKRRTVLRLLAASGALTAWHLMPGAGARRAVAAKRGGHLRAAWAGAAEIVTLDPARMNQVLQFQITSNVLSGLTHINNKLVAEGDLAKDWSVSDDGKEWTFNLREGVTFHNGDPFTADDVIFTYNRSKDPRKSIHSRVVSNIAEVVKINDHTVKIILKAPQASFLVKTLERSSGRAMTIVSRGALASMGESQYGLTPVGTGPFRATFHQLGQGVVLERFDKYYDPERPLLDKVTIIPITDPEPLAAAIEAGDVELIGGNSPSSELIDRFEANPDLVVNSAPAPGFQAVWINPWREPFRVTDFNKPLDELLQEKGFKVRMAIAKALDRDRFIKQALFGRGVPAYGSINPAMGFFFDETLGERSAQRYEPDVARKLLAEAGYPDGKGFPKLKLLHSPSLRRESQVVADILKRNLGIEVELETKDQPVVLQDFLKMDFDIARLGSGGDFDPDDAIVDWMQTESKFNGLKRDKEKMPFGYFSDKEADALIDQQRLETDLAKRKELVQKANKITSDKVACGFLFHPMSILVHRKSVDYPAVSRIPGLVDLDRTSLV